MASTPSADMNHQNGISIKDALSILSNRACEGGDNHQFSSNSGHDTIPEELKNMGQTINITNQMEFANVDETGRKGCKCIKTGSTKDSPVESSVMRPEEDKAHEAMTQQRMQRRAEIQDRLESLDVSDLLSTIFSAQQERVVTYKKFEEGIVTVLNSRNMTNYPALCAKVTASFSVLSDTINSVKSIVVDKYKRNDIGKVIHKLQQHESEKLNLTAALHLERMRLNNADVMGSGSNDLDERTKSLLNHGVSSLESKIAIEVESINEQIDELRCFATDESA